MAYSIVWNVDADGLWGTASNWNTGVLPGASDDAGIHTADFHTITLSDETATVHSLTVGNDAFEEVNGSDLSIAGAARFGSGLTIEVSALTLSGNTEVSGPFSSLGGTFNNTGTLRLTGAAHFGAYTYLSGDGKTLMQGATTLNGTIYLDNGQILENQGTLTVNGISQIDLGYGDFVDPTITSGSLKNDIGATIIFSGADCEIYDLRGPTTFINAGTLVNTNNAHSAIGEYADFINSGTVHVQSGELDIYGSMKGAGTVTIDSGASFYLHASATVDNPEITTPVNVNILAGTGLANLTGGSGNDIFKFAGNFTASDVVNGSSGSDQLVLNGNYSAGLTFGPATVANIETMLLQAGYSYNLVTDDATVAAGQTLVVNAIALGTSNALTFDGSAETDGRFTIHGGKGNDVITAGAGNDALDLSYGGNDTANGGGGNDSFVLGSTFTAADKLDGGTGYDTVTLKGDYSAGVFLNASTMANVEDLNLAGGHSYKLVMNDANVAAGESLRVDGSALGASDILIFNGAAETDGRFNIIGGAGNDYLTGGQGHDMLAGGLGNDTLNLSSGGSDVASGGDGNDTFVMGAALTATGKLDGGIGYDTVTLKGDYSAGVTFGAATMVNVENMNLAGGYSYKLATNDANVASGQSLRVDGSALGASDTLNFNGAAETDGRFKIIGGVGNDNLTAGKGNDIITGGSGADVLAGGGGADHFIYSAVSDSTSVNYDTIAGFDFSADRFDFNFAVGGIDTAVATGALSTASFDNDLSNALSGHLNGYHAVLFTPDSGTLSGQTFLVVDANGAAGYQANVDFVFHLTAATGTLAATDFV